MSESELFDVVIGKSTAATIDRLCNLIPGSTNPQIHDAIEAAEMDAIADGIEAFVGAADALRLFKGRCCVASNGSRAKMTASLTSTGLIRWVQGRLLSSEDVANPKPAPDLFLLCATKFAIPPERCLVIEDSEAGLEAARLAGMPVVGLTHHLSEAQVRAWGAVPFAGLVEWLESCKHEGT